MSLKLNLAGFLSALGAALIPAAITKVADQAEGVTKGDQTVADAGITPVHISGADAKAIEQAAINTALAAAKPVIEHTINTAVDSAIVAIVTKYVPAEEREAAIADGEAAAHKAVDAPIEAWQISV